ncbi:glycosyltransferase family 39 protein [Methylomonas sp. UP202]|uniref:phospholipid carrier-dependent glycosyltransferase n=1 Tax=Methylomonas sp. UP202 TaxID=3040943 RepID=UPI0024794C4B|nr:glycosyltransferase family 39 protein [Methylomonas sp. UP202]WGS84669.1 glycosyltransferase family 39 protein [Methylomonas sp. UP202]
MGTNGIRHWLPSLGALLVASFLIALCLANWLLPIRQGPIRDQMPDGWMGAEHAERRAYFRQTWRLPFKPEHGWVALAADDYQLMVNGRVVSWNKYSINASLPFQTRFSDRAQGQVPHSWDMPRNPTSQRAANEEWRVLHYIDITPYLLPGENTLAVYVQSQHLPRLAIKGGASGEGLRADIDGRAEAWRALDVAANLTGKRFFEPGYNETEWPAARPLGELEKPVYAPVDPTIWTTPRSELGLSGVWLAGDMRLATELVDLHRVAGDSAWVRIGCDWPYYLFWDDELVGAGGGGGGIEAFDMTRFLAADRGRLSVRVVRPNSETAPPVLFVDGRLGQRVLDGGLHWQTQIQAHPDWLSGAGQWIAAATLSADSRLGALKLQTAEPIDADWMVQFLSLWLVSAGACWLAVRLFRLGAGASAEGYAGRGPSGLLAIGAIAALMLIALRVRYGETDSVLWLEDPVWRPIWMGWVPTVTLLSWWLLRRPAFSVSWPETGRWVRDSRLWLGLTLVAGFALRYYQIGFDDLQADENVSWDASRGILKGLSPEAVSGVLYTRSPLYHYVLALWLAVFGDSKEIARGLSIVPGLGVIIAAYLLTLRIGGRRGLALLVAVLLAFDPWQIFISRIIRFYQFMQFLGVVSVYLFLRGFIWRDGRRYQHWFFVFCTATALSQEVFVITFPAFCIAGFLYYKPFDWRADRSILIGFATMMTVTIADMVIFTILCLTPHVGIATSSDSIMKLHLINPHVFINLFLLGNQRMALAYSVLVVSGFWYWFRGRKSDPAIVTLYLLVFVSAFVASVLLMQIANRYVSPLYPFLIVLAVLTGRGWIDVLAERIFGTGAAVELLRNRWRTIVAGLLLTLVPFQSDPLALVDAYSRPINMGHETAYHFIAAQKSPDDKILTVSPMSAAIVMGGVDYYLMETLSFDEVYRHASVQGQVVDRWAGGKLVTNLEELRRLFNQHRRVWVITDEMESKKMSDELLGFLERTSEVRYEFFGGKVLLWDAGRGLY